MKLSLLIAAAFCLTACGYSGTDAEAVGQAKKLTHRTPLVCPNYDSVDISLGIMRGGTGSMSTQDIWLTIPDKRDLDTLRGAVETAAIVKVKYDTRRVAFCTDELILTGVEVVRQ